MIYPSIKNGRLNFPTTDAFKNYMTAIQKLPIEEVEAMNVSHGFKSHYASGKGAADVSGLGTRSTAEDTYIVDDYFASTLNEEHQIQVDAYTWEANNDYSYMVPEGSEDDILDFETALANGMVNPQDMPTDGQYYDNVYVYPTHLSLDIQEAQLDGNKDNKLNTRGELSKRQIQYSYFDGGTWRLHAEAWKASWLLYASIGVESKCNKVANFFSLWKYYVNKNINSLGLGYEGTQTVSLDFAQSGPTSTNPPGVTGTLFQVKNVDFPFRNVFGESLFQEKFDWQTANIPLFGKFNPFKAIAKFRIVGMKLNTRHEGNKDGVVRRINMSVEIKP